MADKKLRFEVEADTTKAEDSLDDVTDKVNELEGEKFEAKVGINEDQVRAQVQDVFDDLERLRSADPTVKIKVDEEAIGRAKTQVDGLGDGGSEAGKRFGGSFAADLGGMINSQVGGIGDQFVQGFGAALEGAGVSASLGGPLMAALGIGTVVAAAATTLWQAMNAGAEEYKKKVEEATELQKNLATGQLNQAVADLEKKLAPMAKTMSQFGISTGEAAKFILGATDELGLFNQEMNPDLMAQVDARAKELGVTNGDLMMKFRDTRNELLSLRSSTDEAGTGFAHTQQRMFEIIAAMEDTGASTEEVTGALADLAKQTKGPTQDAIVNHIATINGIPKSRVTDILADTNPDNLAQVQHEIDVLTKARSVPVRFAVDVNAGDIAAQVRAAVALAGGTVTTAQSVNQYQARNGPLR